jgi:SET domain-containing protein
VGVVIGEVFVAEAGAKGLGVFARRAFVPGEFIFRRRMGPPIANAVLATMSEEDQRHICELDSETSAILLPPGCYLNHACEPNAMRSGVAVLAWRGIAAGEEITIDYRLNAFSGERCECSCGSAHCPGWFDLSFFAMEPERQRAYLPFAPRFIRREWRARHPR